MTASSMTCERMLIVCSFFCTLSQFVWCCVRDALHWPRRSPLSWEDFVCIYNSICGPKVWENQGSPVQPLFCRPTWHWDMCQSKLLGLLLLIMYMNKSSNSERRVAPSLPAPWLLSATTYWHQLKKWNGLVTGGSIGNTVFWKIVPHARRSPV